ncbi:hypothetical protein [Pseudanabaena sp. UWO310]|uniref:hypothetical protein n=1 Tax=Pseudanabaena sp. UWO310 TaxID=2480795 RepID=UPI001680C059|nr:hypothetical protein [Pseudanabaena sp. UWO310]
MSKCAPKALFNRVLTNLDVSIATYAIGAKLMNINICIVLYIAEVAVFPKSIKMGGGA